MSHTHRPRLRPGLAAGRDPDDGRLVVWDQNRLTHRLARVSDVELQWVEQFDGRRTLPELADAFRSQGIACSVDALAALTDRLDEALFLDSARFLEYVQGPVRDPSCIGVYAAEPAALRHQLARLFEAQGGPGALPDQPCDAADGGPLRALLVPHMDFTRGNVTYGWGFRHLFENTSARLFVIIGTSHYSHSRFTLTRQNYRTPFGEVETDQTFIDRMVEMYGDSVFDDPVAHLPEHSIELEVVLLQYLYEGRRPFRIVPLLVGSFGDAVRSRGSPSDLNDIAAMVTTLSAAEDAAGEPVCYIISGDLAHIGPKFDDPEPVDEPLLEHSEAQDRKIIHAAENTNADGYFRVIASEQDRRRICGLPPTWMTLSAAKPSRGRLLHYGRYVHPQGYESVSFASMAFDR